MMTTQSAAHINYDVTAGSEILRTDKTDAGEFSPFILTTFSLSPSSRISFAKQFSPPPRICFISDNFGHRITAIAHFVLLTRHNEKSILDVEARNDRLPRVNKKNKKIERDFFLARL